MLLHLPPPVHGVSTVCANVLGMPYLRKWNVKTIKINLSRSVSEIGRFQIKKTLYIFSILIRLLSNLIFIKPDVVYFAFYPTGKAFYLKDMIYLIIIKIFRVKLILHMHNTGLTRELQKSIILKRIYVWLLKNSYIIFVSETQKRLEVQELNSDRSHFIVIKNGVKEINTEKYKKNRCNKHIELLFFSNFFKEKGVFFLISGLKKLLKNDTRFHLTIAGQDYNNNKKKIYRYIEKNDLKKSVTVINELKSEEEKWNLFGSADIFIFPSYFEETSSLVLIEAMQFGIPIIASDTGAIPELLMGQCGVLFKRKNPDKLLLAIKNLIEDKILQHQLIKNARECYLKKYTINQFYRSLENLLKETVNE